VHFGTTVSSLSLIVPPKLYRNKTLPDAGPFMSIRVCCPTPDNKWVKLPDRLKFSHGIHQDVKPLNGSFILLIDLAFLDTHDPSLQPWKGVFKHLHQDALTDLNE
jgi:hypothetical protein